jgi:hypothetical protein
MAGAESLMCGLESRLTEFRGRLKKVCNDRKITLDQGVDILAHKAKQLFGPLTANLDTSNISSRNTKNFYDDHDTIGLRQFATCVAASRRLGNGDPTIIFHAPETNRESFNNLELLTTFACIFSGDVENVTATTVVRLSGIKRVVELLQAACERYGTKLTLASDVGKDIIQVADAEVNRKDQLQVSLKAYHDSINYYVNMNLTEDETKVYNLMTQVSTVIHGRLIVEGLLKAKENDNIKTESTNDQSETKKRKAKCD